MEGAKKKTESNGGWTMAGGVRREEVVDGGGDRKREEVDDGGWNQWE